MKHIVYHQFMGLLHVTKFRNYQVNKKSVVQKYSCALDLLLLLVLNELLLLLLIQILHYFQYIINTD